MTMDMGVLPGNLSHIHPQIDSPLFSKIPPEIREEIFTLSVSSYLDDSQTYPFHSYWYRPGYTAPRKTSLSLLLTCKAIYGEARDLVFKEGTGNDELIIYYGYTKHRPPGMCPNFHPGRLSTHYRHHITKAHILSPIHPFLSEFNQQMLLPVPLETVHATVRHVDCPGWNNSDTRYLWLPTDLRRTCLPASVNTLILQLETVEWKLEGLEAQISVIKSQKDGGWQWKKENGEYLTLDLKEGVKTWTWMGTTNYGDQTLSLPLYPFSDTMEYTVKVLTFR
ncbi:hypothetical protein BKA70DRAFT_1350031 [Coprinopsis sp. MPI-PUGE-AT-0042]|nr:hypothetical protein BKA70DRAFT_1350031 [Coprinopsis sp. MPI-PUGE-AT-0042]